MKDLTPLERRMTAMVLKMAAQEFGRHGCNDLDLRKLGLTQDEIAELHQRMAKFNGDPEDVLSGDIVPDWYVMSYLAYLQDPTVKQGPDGES